MDPVDLIVLEGPLRGARFPLHEGRTVVGRSSSCDLTLDDPEISRRHLTVTIAGDRICIADRGSTNGTYLEGEPIRGETPVPLGATVTIGATVMSFEHAPLPGPVSRSDLAVPGGAWTVGLGRGPYGTDVTVDLADGNLVVVGPYRSGKSTALAAVAASARRLEDRPQLHLLAPRQSPLTELVGWDSMAIGRDDVELAMAALGDVMHRGRKTLVLLDDGQEMLDHDDPEFERIMRSARDTALRFAVAVEVGAALRTFGGWFVEVRRQRKGLLLQPDRPVDGDLFGVTLPGEPRAFGPGAGYLIDGPDRSLVRIATDVEQHPRDGLVLEE